MSTVDYQASPYIPSSKEPIAFGDWLQLDNRGTCFCLEPGGVVFRYSHDYVAQIAYIPRDKKRPEMVVNCSMCFTANREIYPVELVGGNVHG